MFLKKRKISISIYLVLENTDFENISRRLPKLNKAVWGPFFVLNGR